MKPDTTYFTPFFSSGYAFYSNYYYFFGMMIIL